MWILPAALASEGSGNEVLRDQAAACPDPSPQRTPRDRVRTWTWSQVGPLPTGMAMCTAQGCGFPCDRGGSVVPEGVATGGWTPDAAVAAWNAGRVSTSWCGSGAPADGDWALARVPGEVVRVDVPWKDPFPGRRLLYDCPWRTVLRIPVAVTAPFLAGPVETFLLVTGDDPAGWDLAGRVPEPLGPLAADERPPDPAPRQLAPAFAAWLGAPDATGSRAMFRVPTGSGPRRTVLLFAETPTEALGVAGRWAWAPP